MNARSARIPAHAAPHAVLQSRPREHPSRRRAAPAGHTRSREWEFSLDDAFEREFVLGTLGGAPRLTAFPVAPARFSVAAMVSKDVARLWAVSLRSPIQSSTTLNAMSPRAMSARAMTTAADTVGAIDALEGAAKPMNIANANVTSARAALDTAMGNSKAP